VHTGDEPLAARETLALPFMLAPEFMRNHPAVHGKMSATNSLARSPPFSYAFSDPTIMAIMSTLLPPARIVLSGLLALAAVSSANASTLELTSPSQTLTARLANTVDGNLSWSLHRGTTELIQPSRLGITVGEHDLGSNLSLGEPQVRTLSNTYPWRGVKHTATNSCRAYRIPLRHTPSNVDWILEARVYDDGFAFRYHVPGVGPRTVFGEHSSWTLPPAARIWFQTDTGGYEGEYRSATPQDVPTETTTDRGPRPVVLGPPVTATLPDDSLLLITEANLVNYSGMTLRPTGTPRLEAAFEDDPSGFAIDGPIVSPWRVTVAVTDLNALVNTDIIHNLADPPNPTLFPDGIRTDWIRPGRALITWCVFGNDGAQWHLQKWFVDQCAALRCEYLLVDGGWRTERWGYLANGGDLWQRLKEICDYAAARDVGIIVWNAYPEGRNDGPGLTDPEAQRDFFKKCSLAGVKGVKIDFFNSEKKTIIDAYHNLARLAAENQLLINFHGANKPTGEVRTWPNEVTREGIREQEYLLWEQLSLEHYTALPFTRLVAGHADFLPTYVRKKYLKNTTATFQMATAVIAASSFHSWPDHPDHYLASPFLGLIQVIPLVWDETIVLPNSRIGRQVAFARRAGSSWYVAVLNGTEQPQEWTCSLDFLPKGEYFGTLYNDASPHPEGVRIDPGSTLTHNDHLTTELAPGGGFVAWLKPLKKPLPDAK